MNEHLRGELPSVKRNIEDLMEAQVQLADAMEEAYERLDNLQKQIYTLLAVIVGLAGIIVSGYL